MSLESTEEYFQKATEQYRLLEQEALELVNELASLPPEEILKRCTRLQELQADIAEDDNRLIELMKFVGEPILDMPFLGEYQRALASAIEASDKISARIQSQKILLASELDKLQDGRKELTG